MFVNAHQPAAERRAGVPGIEDPAAEIETDRFLPRKSTFLWRARTVSFRKRIEFVYRASSQRVLRKTPGCERRFTAGRGVWVYFTMSLVILARVRRLRIAEEIFRKSSFTDGSMPSSSSECLAPMAV